MTLDGFLSFLALVAAIYALAPAVTRLSMRLKSITALVVAALAFALTTYLLLFDTVGQPCALQSRHVCKVLEFDPPNTISPAEAAFFVVLAWLSVTIWMLTRAKLGASALQGLSRVVAELADEKRYGELLKLIEPQLLLLDRAATRKLFTQRFYDEIQTAHPSRATHEQIIDLLEGENDTPRWKQLVAKVILPVLPKGERAEIAAQEIFRRVMRSPQVLEYLARFRPDFGIRLMSISARSVHDFSDQFLADLIAHPGSALYEEVKENQNLDRRGYQLPARNRLLHFLLSDASRAYKLAPYRPIGEHAIAVLRADMHPEYVVFLNGSAEDIEREKWSDPVFVALRFFDIMVHAAMYQGIKWHMWLYYSGHICRALVGIYDSSRSSQIDQFAEWPTRCSYLLYELFSDLTDWIRGAEDLKPGEHHLDVESDEVTHDNGNIPKSAALCLGDCMRTLFLAANVPWKFKKYISDMVFRRISEMRESGPVAIIRRSAIKSIAAGGVLGPDGGYGAALQRALESVDHFVREDLADLGAELKRVYGS